MRGLRGARLAPINGVRARGGGVQGPLITQLLQRYTQHLGEALGDVRLGLEGPPLDLAHHALRYAHLAGQSYLRPSSLLSEIPHLAAIHDQCDVGDTYPTHTAGERAVAPLHIPKMGKSNVDQPRPGRHMPTQHSEIDKGRIRWNRP